MNEDIKPITQKQRKVECATFTYRTACLRQYLTHKN